MSSTKNKKTFCTFIRKGRSALEDLFNKKIKLNSCLGCRKLFGMHLQYYHLSNYKEENVLDVFTVFNLFVQHALRNKTVKVIRITLITLKNIFLSCYSTF
jgi:hypothetical protein